MPGKKKKTEISPVRLVGYFVGGILLANLVLMTSAAFRGDAASAPSTNSGLAARRGPAAAVGAEKSLQTMAAPEAPAPREAPAPGRESADRTIAEAPARPAITTVCARARERLIAAMAHYYLQRSRRPHASAEDVSEAAGATVLLAGPADPSVQTAACAG